MCNREKDIAFMFGTASYVARKVSKLPSEVVGRFVNSLGVSRSLSMKIFKDAGCYTKYKQFDTNDERELLTYLVLKELGAAVQGNINLLMDAVFGKSKHKPEFSKGFMETPCKPSLEVVWRTGRVRGNGKTPSEESVLTSPTMRTKQVEFQRLPKSAAMEEALNKIEAALAKSGSIGFRIQQSEELANELLKAKEDMHNIDYEVQVVRAMSESKRYVPRDSFLKEPKFTNLCQEIELTNTKESNMSLKITTPTMVGNINIDNAPKSTLTAIIRAANKQIEDNKDLEAISKTFKEEKEELEKVIKLCVEQLDK